MTATATRPAWLGFTALATLAKGLAWLTVLALVLAQLDWLLPRKATASNESMDAMDSLALEAIADLRAAGAAADADLAAVADELAAALAAPAPVEPMVHPVVALAQQTAPFTIKGLRRMAQEAGATDWRKATELQLMAGLYAIA